MCITHVFFLYPNVSAGTRKIQDIVEHQKIAQHLTLFAVNFLSIRTWKINTRWPFKKIKCTKIHFRSLQSFSPQIIAQCCQFPPFFAIAATIVIITRCCPAVALSSNYGLSWVCYAPFERLKQKEASASKRLWTKGKVALATNLLHGSLFTSPLNGVTGEPFPHATAMQSWPTLSPCSPVQLQINGTTKMHECTPLIYVLLCTCQVGPRYLDHHLPVDTEMLQRQRDPLSTRQPLIHIWNNSTQRGEGWRCVGVVGVGWGGGRHSAFQFLTLIFIIYLLSFKGDSSTMASAHRLVPSLPLSVHLTVNFETLARSLRISLTGTVGNLMRIWCRLEGPAEFSYQELLLYLRPRVFFSISSFLHTVCTTINAITC